MGDGEEKIERNKEIGWDEEEKRDIERRNIWGMDSSLFIRRSQLQSVLMNVSFSSRCFKSEK